MQRDPRAFLWDVRDAALAIQGFVAGMDAAAYEANAMAQAAHPWLRHGQSRYCVERLAQCIATAAGCR